MKLIFKSFLTLCLALPLLSHAQDSEGSWSTADLYWYLNSNPNLEATDTVHGPCQVVNLEIDESGALDLSVANFSKQVDVTLLGDGSIREGLYRGEAAEIVEFDYVFHKLQMALDHEGEILHIRLQNIYDEEVLNQIDCVKPWWE